MESDAYLRFLVVLILALSASGLVAGAIWSVPDAYRAYRYWRGATRGDPSGRSKPRRVYSYWRLVRTLISYVSLAAFFGVGLVVLIIADAESPTRMLLTRHLLLLVVVCLAALLVLEPLSERRLEFAMEETDGEGD